MTPAPTPMPAPEPPIETAAGAGAAGGGESWACAAAPRPRTTAADNAMISFLVRFISTPRGLWISMNYFAYFDDPRYPGKAGLVNFLAGSKLLGALTNSRTATSQNRKREPVRRGITRLRRGSGRTPARARRWPRGADRRGGACRRRRRARSGRGDRTGWWPATPGAVRAPRPATPSPPAPRPRSGWARGGPGTGSAPAPAP